MILMRMFRGWLVLVAVAAAGLAYWWTESIHGPQWLEASAFVGAFVGTTAATALAQSYMDRLRERAVARRRATRVLDPPPPETRAGLLRADRHIVPFTGREAERAELRRWCQGDKPSVRLIVGAGGVGKTRLALYLGEYLQGLKPIGWSVTVIGAGREADALETLPTTRRPMLLIVDYAETRTGLVELLRSVAGHGGRIRVLLIARSAGDWWRKLGADISAVRALVEEYPPWELPVRVDSTADAAGLVRAAIPCFAAALGVPAPRTDIVPPPADAPLLVLHATALLAVVRSQDDPQAPAGQLVADLGVLTDLLGHERRFWAQSAQQRNLDLELDVLERAVALACLFGAENESDGAELLRRAQDLRDDDRLRRRVAQWLAELYPRGRHPPERRPGAAETGPGHRYRAVGASGA